jgi:hypothetical protein
MVFICFYDDFHQGLPFMGNGTSAVALLAAEKLAGFKMRIASGIRPVNQPGQNDQTLSRFVAEC